MESWFVRNHNDEYDIHKAAFNIIYNSLSPVLSNKILLYLMYVIFGRGVLLMNSGVLRIVSVDTYNHLQAYSYIIVDVLYDFSTVIQYNPYSFLPSSFSLSLFLL